MGSGFFRVIGAAAVLATAGLAATPQELPRGLAVPTLAPTPAPTPTPTPAPPPTPEPTVGAANELCITGLPTAAVGTIVPAGCATAYKTGTCTVSCDEGWEGTAQVFTCGDAQTMTGTMPTCAEMKCPKATLDAVPGYTCATTPCDRTFEFVSSSCDDVKVGGTCRLSCPAGYEEKDSFLTCGPNKKFTGPPISDCVRKGCEADTIIQGPGVDISKCLRLPSQERIFPTETCELSCLSGFSGTATLLTCGADLAFAGAAPVCERGVRHGSLDDRQPHQGGDHVCEQVPGRGVRGVLQ